MPAHGHPPADAELQRAYYEQTADHYDHLHTATEGEHDIPLRYMSNFLGLLGAQSLLDVGSGTGRVLAYLRDHHTGLELHGIEPVPALIAQATARRGLPEGMIQPGSGDALPFADASVDVVCAYGVLHHVRDPSKVIGEMTRVARKAVFISDSNRFGQGSVPARLVKLALARAGLWGMANWLKTRGKGYTLSEGDGLAYSYSVYDSQEQLRRWAPRVFFIPTQETNAAAWAHPLLTSPSILVCAIKDDRPAQP